MVYSTLSDLGYVQCMQPASLSSQTPLGRCPGIFFLYLESLLQDPGAQLQTPETPVYRTVA